jgi:ABC-type dipeptide/oligopeptide/nickel transport system permease subunit
MSATTFDPTGGAPLLPSARSERRIRRAASYAAGHKLLVISGFVVFAYVAIAIFGRFVAPYSPNESHPGSNYMAPGGEFLLGTDKEGRDLLSRMLYGGLTTLFGAFVVMMIATVGGFMLGLITAYVGGWFDRTLMRLFDVILSIPPLVLAIVLVASLGPGLLPVVIGIGVGYLPAIARIIRSEALVQRSQQYVQAGHGLGYSGRRIVFRHLMPNCTSQIIVQASLNVPYAIIDIAGLSFLGFGVQPPTSDWGTMLAEGQGSLLFAPWLVYVPGAAITIFVLAWSIFGARLRQALDPRER